MPCRILAALLLAALATASAPAAAWGPLGHRLIAELAWDGMTPEARAEARTLLAGEDDPTLAGIANWADELRAHDPDLGRRSARWHYINLAEDGCQYDAVRHCKGGNCVVEAINTQAAILADRSRPRAERLQALKFVVHFVGDVHQPLHAGYGHDKGGNDFQVNFRDRGSNLHALWDSGLLNSTRRSETQWLDWLRALPTSADCPDCSPFRRWLAQLLGLSVTETPVAPTAAAWAEASCSVVVRPGFYPDPARRNIDDAYVQQWLPVAEQQLRDGGQRLADLLNTALGG